MSLRLRRVREFFLQRDLEARAAEIPTEVHAKTSRALRVSRQRRDAAEALWLAGFPAEALRLEHHALDHAREAIVEAGGSVEAPATIDLPVFDEDVTAAHGVVFRALLTEHARLLQTREELELAPAEVASRRRTRVAVVIAGAVALVATAVLVLRTPRVLRATASGIWDGRYVAANAVDGSESTDWLLPDRVEGWLEVQVIPPRNVKRVKVMNARNLPWNDRGTHELSIEVFDGARLVKTEAAKYDAASPEPAWRSVPVDAKIDRVRVLVRSWHASGGGVSEVVVE